MKPLPPHRSSLGARLLGVPRAASPAASLVGLWVGLFVGLAPACGGASGGEPDVADALEDTSPTPDVGEDTLVGDTFVPNPDEHPFDELAVDASGAPPALCLVTSDPEQARILRLGPLTRGGTGEADLAAASLGVVDLFEGPWWGEQHLDLAVAGASLDRWEVVGDAAGVLLDATVRHDLGALGAVEERYALRRAGPADLAPAALDAVTEVTFWFVPSAGGVEAAQLFPCGPEGARHEDRVLVARSGERRIALLELGDPRAAAGPYTRRVFVTYGDNRLLDSIDGYWALAATRAPVGHLAHLAVDLTRSAAHRQLYFSDSRLGWITAATVALEVDDGGLVVTTRHFPGEEDTKEPWEIERPWARVDGPTLIAAHPGACGGADPESLLIGRHGVAFRIVFCPVASAPGIDLLAIVPVMVDLALPIVGGTFTAIEPYVDGDARPGFEIDLDGHRLTLTRGDTSGWFLLHLFDPEGGSLVSQVAEEVELAAGFAVTGQDVDQVSDDRAVELRITRLWAGQGAGHTSIFAPLAFHLTHGEDVVRVEAWDRMAYTNTHHNWDDVLEVTTDERVYRWTVQTFGIGAILEVLDLEGEVLETHTMIDRASR